MSELKKETTKRSYTILYLPADCRCTNTANIYAVDLSDAMKRIHEVVEFDADIIDVWEDLK